MKVLEAEFANDSTAKSCEVEHIDLQKLKVFDFE